MFDALTIDEAIRLVTMLRNAHRDTLALRDLFCELSLSCSVAVACRHFDIHAHGLSNIASEQLTIMHDVGNRYVP
jgi:hypothetical protein